MTVPIHAMHRVPPYVVQDGLLPVGDLTDLLDFAVANEAKFAPAALSSSGGPGRIDRAFRTSRALERATFKPWRARMKAIVAPLLPGILHDLGMQPFELAGFELELVRHNDGDFFRRHIDTSNDAHSVGRRAVSMVYYFHADPKAFEGGALRLYSLASNAVFEDVEPAHNRLVAFASWVPHEVMTISCPSRRFIDSRFAINCWARMMTPDQPPA